MNMIALAHRTLNTARNGERRVYMEGSALARSGFTPGAALVVQVRIGCVRLEVAEVGSHTVSQKKRQRATVTVPVVDVRGVRITEALGSTTDAVEVRYFAGAIEIGCRPVDLAVLHREAALAEALMRRMLTMGSVCHGGGITSHAVHTGFDDAGVPTELSFAVELDERRLDASIRRGDVIGPHTLTVAADISEVDQSVFPTVNVLEAGLPCQGASRQGKAKNNNADAFDHEHGLAAVGYIELLKRVNPALVLIENVPEWIDDAQGRLVHQVLRARGYDVAHRLVDGTAFGALERRKRLCLLAVSRGLVTRTGSAAAVLESVTAQQARPLCLGMVLESMAEDDERWFSLAAYHARDAKNKAHGRNFATHVVTAASECVNMIGASYWRRRPSEAKLQHPSDPCKARQLTPREHARVKGIPEHVAPLDESLTMAHTIMGNSVTYPTWRAIGSAVGRALHGLRGGRCAAA